MGVSPRTHGCSIPFYMVNLPDQKGLHPFFTQSGWRSSNDSSGYSKENEPINAPAEQDVGDTLEPDPNPRRGKRRKVSKTESENNDWLSQLNVAAGKEDVENQEIVELDGCGGEAISKSESAGHNANTELAPSEQQKPPLQLDGRGRLRTLEDPMEHYHDLNNRCEGKPPPKRGRPRKTLLVVMRYGRSNLHQRQKIGLRLSDILNSCRKSKNEDEPNTQPLKAQATNPSKPTHPFFLGQATSESVVEKSNEQSQVKEKEELSTKNYKTFSTPGKLKDFATNAEHSKPTFFGLNADATRKVKQHATSHRGLVLPWRGVTRIEPTVDDVPSQIHSRPNIHALSQRRFKNKTVDTGVEYLIPKSMIDKVELKVSVALDEVGALDSADAQVLNVPNQLMQTGEELQHCIKSQISDEDPKKLLPHAVSRLYQWLQIQRTPFDLGSCESNWWNQKYAPQASVDLLQSNREMTSLREWLKSLTVSNVGSGVDSTKSARSANVSKNSSAEMNLTMPSGKKRGKTKDVDDFIISSDDDKGELRAVSDEEGPFNHSLSAKRSMIRAEGILSKSKSPDVKRSNVVLLSGPHGCGKTAAAHAVAHELDFEIFEINSATRRSGRDVIDKVGDMALNHQVRRRSNPFSDVVTCDNETGAGQQSMTLDSVFASSKTKQTSSAPSKARLGGQDFAKPPARRQKQSLILLEEVDILFEDDKQFWETVLDLALQSKRPIIMTCSDESLLPINDLSLHAIFRLQSPPSDIATKHMLVMAALEGHLLDYDAVQELYKSRGHDLRASISDLNFWCQMAVGDEKGGMGWFLKAQNTLQSDGIESSGRRVISNGTYQTGLDWLPCSSNDHDDFDSQEEIALAAWSQWGIDPSVLSTPGSESDSLSVHIDHATSPSAPLSILAQYSEYSDSASAADIVCQVDNPGQHANNLDSLGSIQGAETIIAYDRLDPSLPELSESQKMDFFQGRPVLQADLMRDFEQLGAHIKVAIHLCLHRLWKNQNPSIKEPNNSTKALASHYIERIKQAHTKRADVNHHESNALIQAILPIFDDVETSDSINRTACYPTWDHSRMDVTQDIGPYLRSIVDYDLALERRRQALEESLLGGKRSSKRIRMTRASRSALQGGQRTTARRERWLPKELNHEAVSKTRGTHWPRPSVELEGSDVMLEEPERDISQSVSSSRQSSVKSSG